LVFCNVVAAVGNDSAKKGAGLRLKGNENRPLGNLSWPKDDPQRLVWSIYKGPEQGLPKR